MSPEVCPNCGAVVPRNARCCPACGANEATGWSDSAQAAHLAIPDDTFDYDQFVKEEFGATPKPRGIRWVWWITALVMALLFLMFFLR